MSTDALRQDLAGTEITINKGEWLTQAMLRILKEKKPVEYREITNQTRRELFELAKEISKTLPAKHKRAQGNLNPVYAGEHFKVAAAPEESGGPQAPAIPAEKPDNTVPAPARRKEAGTPVAPAAKHEQPVSKKSKKAPKPTPHEIELQNELDAANKKAEEAQNKLEVLEKANKIIALKEEAKKNSDSLAKQGKYEEAAKPYEEAWKLGDVQSASEASKLLLGRATQLKLGGADFATVSEIYERAKAMAVIWKNDSVLKAVESGEKENAARKERADKQEADKKQKEAKEAAEKKGIADVASKFGIDPKLVTKTEEGYSYDVPWTITDYDFKEIDGKWFVLKDGEFRDPKMFAKSGLSDSQKSFLQAVIDTNTKIAVK